MTKFAVTVELEHISGVELDDDTLIDYFCAAIGRQNGARPPLRITHDDEERNETAVYEVLLVDDLVSS